jgi:hypothetical protein
MHGQFPCPECGQPILIMIHRKGDVARCLTCGAKVEMPESLGVFTQPVEQSPASDEVPESAPSMSATSTAAAIDQTTAVQSDLSLVGVKGWLLFLCVVMTVLNPLLNLWLVWKNWTTYKGLETVADLYPGIGFVIYVEIVFGLAFAGLSYYAGRRMWFVRHNAVKVAKAVFIAAILWPLFDSLLVSIVDIPNYTFWDALKESGRGGTSASLWLVYLLRSKRVKATYSTGSEPLTPSVS